MNNFLKTTFRKSHLLTQQAFTDLLASASYVFEKDRYGIKVAQLTDGTMIKVFRVKRFFSAAQIYSYARRFCRNIDRLQQRNIPVPEVLRLYHVKSSRLSVVHYSPLPGKTIKDIMKEGLLNETLAYQVGEFIAKVHALGIYFRGLHIGNIVLTPNGELGLIDVSELSIYWHLSRYRRLRNFARFWRSQEDAIQFGEANIKDLIDGYVLSDKQTRVKVRAEAIKLKLS
jgi:tRNA A-37 threonylcarbamoyl transferase component Bud32